MYFCPFSGANWCFRECSTGPCNLLTSTFGLPEGRRIWPLPICRMHDFIVLRLMVLRYLGVQKKNSLSAKKVQNEKAWCWWTNYATKVKRGTHQLNKYTTTYSDQQYAPVLMIKALSRMNIFSANVFLRLTLVILSIKSAFPKNGTIDPSRHFITTNPQVGHPQTLVFGKGISRRGP